METIRAIIDWIVANYQNVFYLISSIVVVGSLVVRFTKTKTDDDFMQRISDFITKIMDWLKIPNRVVGGDKK